MTLFRSWAWLWSALLLSGHLAARDLPSPIMFSGSRPNAISPPLQRLDIRTDILGNMATSRIRMDFRVMEADEWTLAMPLAAGEEVLGLKAGCLSEGGDWNSIPSSFEPLFPDSEYGFELPPVAMELMGQRVFWWSGLKAGKGILRLQFRLVHPTEALENELKVALPLRFSQVADSFRLRCVIHQQVTPPKCESPAFAPLRLQQYEGQYRFQLQRLFYRADSSLVLKIPQDSEVPRIFLGMDTTSRALVQLLKESDAGSNKRPERILLRWDASASRAEYDWEEDWDRLEKWLRQQRNPEVALQVFSARAEPIEYFEAELGRWKRLREKLESIEYDGATVFPALPEIETDWVIDITELPDPGLSQSQAYWWWRAENVGRPVGMKAGSEVQEIRMQDGEVIRIGLEEGDAMMESTTFPVVWKGEQASLEIREKGKSGERWRVVLPKKEEGMKLVDELIEGKRVKEWYPHARVPEVKVEAQNQLKTDLEELYQDIRAWYQGQYTVGEPLPDPKTGHLPPVPEPEIDSPRNPAILHFPPVGLWADSIFRDPPQTEIQSIRWLQGGRLRAWIGDEGRHGLFQVMGDTIPYLPPSALYQLPEWEPAPRYLENVRFARPEESWRMFLVRRADFQTNPSFFIDFADHLLVGGETEKAIRALSDLLEFGYEDPEILRAAAQRLEVWGAPELALVFFREVVRQRPNDPIALRDLASALESTGRQGGPELLVRALQSDARWFERRYPGLRTIILREINHYPGLYDTLLPSTIFQPMPLDLRVTLDWNRSDTDLDLLVTNPKGERCDYEHSVTSEGGTISGDVTLGFGPEEFVAKSALPGEYTIEVEFEDDPERRISGPTFVKVTVWTDYGRPGEEKKVFPLRLEEKAGKITVAKVAFQ